MLRTEPPEREREIRALLALMTTGRHPGGRVATWAEEQHANVRLEQLRAR